MHADGAPQNDGVEVSTGYRPSVADGGRRGDAEERRAPGAAFGEAEVRVVGPFAAPGLGRRVLPFAAAAAVSFLSFPIPDGVHHDLGYAAAAGAVIVAVVVSGWLVPWRRLPYWTQTAPPLAFFAAVDLLRSSDGGSRSGYIPLVALPMIWIALYGTGRDIALSLAGLLAFFVVPIFAVGPPEYTSGDWRRGALWLVVAGLMEPTIHRLVGEIERRAAAERAALSSLTASAERRRAIFGALEEGLVFQDASGTVLEANHAAEQLIGLSEDQLRGRTPTELGWRAVHEDGSTWPVDEHPAATVLRTGIPVSRAVLGVDAGDGSDGVRRWLRVNAAPVALDDGGHGVVATFSDITAVRDAERALRRTQNYFAALIAHSSDMILVTDRDTHLTFASPAFYAITGLDTANALGRSMSSLAHPDDLEHMGRVAAAMRATPGAVVELEFRLRAADGTWRHIEAVTTNRLDDPAIAGVIANLRDVTDRVVAAQDLTYQAMHDILTGLSNRALLVDRLDVALARSRRSGLAVALYFLDLDGFKQVNDSYGHGAGDQLLVGISGRLRAAVRPEDTVARFGGDEFVVLAEGIATHEEAVQVAARIKEAVALPIEFGARDVAVTASVGIALSNGQSGATLLQEADAALYRAKAAGKDRWELFNQAMRIEARQRVEIERVLAALVENGDVPLVYEPIVRLGDRHLVGAEALLRTVRQGGEDVDGAALIAVAEQSALILPLGRVLLDAALRQAVRWQSAAGAGGSWRVSVNLAARQLGAPAFVEEIARALDEHDVGAEHLAFDVTERVLVEAGSSMGRGVARLAELGALIVLEDFGTGLSSLDHLRRYPVGRLKIAPSLVARLDAESPDEDVVRAIFGLAGAFEMDVVAAGVTTAAQASALSALGCEIAQGPLFGRPGAGDDLTMPGAPPTPT